MGNRFVCCRLSWTLFTNSEEDITQVASYPSRFQFTNHAVFYPPLAAPIDSFPEHNDVYHNRMLNYCYPVANACGMFTESVQHISEREPEDEDWNPSLNATKSTIFLQAIYLSINRHSSLQKILNLSNKLKAKNARSTIQRWSSCGSVYIGGGCLSRPDSKLILHCISVSVCALLKSEKTMKPSSKKLVNNFCHSDSQPLIDSLSDQSPRLTSTYDNDNECFLPLELYKEVYEIYDERVHPLFRSSSSSMHEVDNIPSLDRPPHSNLQFQQHILHFLNRLFSSSLLTAESAIVSLVYLERLISGVGMHIVAWSWRRQFLSCILLACKVLDDQAVWNADYCQLLKDVHVEDLNLLERQTLSLLQFNTGVPPSVYAKYYFDLLTVGNLVAFTDIFSRPQRRMTSEIARSFRILPASAEARTEQSASSLAGGGGMLFDLPCPSPEPEARARAHDDIKTLVMKGNCNQQPVEAINSKKEEDEEGRSEKSEDISEYESSSESSDSVITAAKDTNFQPQSFRFKADPWMISSRTNVVTQPIFTGFQSGSGTVAYSMLQDSGLY